jgi:hypothetical protein
LRDSRFAPDRRDRQLGSCGVVKNGPLYLLRRSGYRRDRTRYKKIENNPMHGSLELPLGWSPDN